MTKAPLTRCPSRKTAPGDPGTALLSQWPACAPDGEPIVFCGVVPTSTIGVMTPMAGIDRLLPGIGAGVFLTGTAVTGVGLGDGDGEGAGVAATGFGEAVTAGLILVAGLLTAREATGNAAQLFVKNDVPRTMTVTKTKIMRFIDKSPNFRI